MWTLSAVDPGFLALSSLIVVHLFANQAKIIGWVWHGRFLSFAAGVSFAYVFVELLPNLEKWQPAIKNSFDPILPYFSKHSYVIALLGVLFYYGLHVNPEKKTPVNFFLNFAGYFFFNFLLGAALSDSNDPEIQPLVLFSIAIGMHIFIVDHGIETEFPDIYGKGIRWYLCASALLGYLFGGLIHIPDAVVAVLMSFIAGGMILNALRYELPKRQNVGFSFFALGSLLYTALLLSIGQK